MIKGLDKLQASLNGLGKQFSDVNMQKVHTKAAEPLITRMHRLAPVGLTGELADSIATLKGRKSNREQGIVESGPARGGRYKGYHAHLVEFGTKERRVKKRHPIFGFDRGKMPKEPFVEPAWEQTKGEVLNRIEKIYSGDVSKYLNRTVPK
jgi:HK97 gp10 family phage protein